MASHYNHIKSKSLPCPTRRCMTWSLPTYPLAFSPLNPQFQDAPTMEAFLPFKYVKLVPSMFSTQGFALICCFCLDAPPTPPFLSGLLPICHLSIHVTLLLAFMCT